MGNLAIFNWVDIKNMTRVEAKVDIHKVGELRYSLL